MLIYTHCWELMNSVGSHGSLSLPFVMKVMVCHFVSDSHEVMTALIVVLPLIVVVEISLQHHQSFCVATASEEPSTNNAGKTLTDTYILPRSILDESPGSGFYVYMMSLMKLVPFVPHAVGFKACIDENSWNGANGMQL